MRKKYSVITALIAVAIIFVKCAKPGTNNAAGNLEALPATVAAPADNLPTGEKIALGKMLFWDPVLSGNKDVACASCHHPSMGYTDGLDLSIGVNGKGLGGLRHFVLPNSIPFVKRNALSIVNTVFNGILPSGFFDAATAPMFFDNRTKSLELQSLEPIKALEEMRGRAISSAAILDTVVTRLKSIPEYNRLFSNAFGSTGTVTTQNLGKAIAAYERTIVANNSPYDEYMRGNTNAMTNGQIQGMNAFVANGCNGCHSGPMFSDFSLHVLGVPDNPKVPTDGGANGSYAFRTAGLRNLSLTAPYMHNGMLGSLDAVLDFYDQTGDNRSHNVHVSNNQLDNKLQRMNDRDKGIIIQFLRALTDTSFDKTIQPSVPSGLHPGGNL